MKILVSTLTSGLSNNAYINRITTKVTYRLNLLKKVCKYTDRRTTKMLFNSLIISLFKYACPILINSGYYPLKKLNTLLLKCTRPILGFQSYKWSTVKIMKSLGWVTIYHIIVMESILFIHKCIFENCPKTITELVTFSINRDINVRNIRKPFLEKQHNSNKVKQSIINKSIYLYN